MKKGIMGESLVFFVSVFAIILLVIVFYVIFRVSGRFENVIKEEKLNEQNLMILDLLKTKLPALEELEKVEKTSVSIETEKNTALKVLKENEILWKEKTYADFLAELYNLKIDNGLKISVFKFVTSSLFSKVEGTRIFAEFPDNLILSEDIGVIGATGIEYTSSVDLPLIDGNFIKVNLYRREK